MRKKEIKVVIKLIKLVSCHTLISKLVETDKKIYKCLVLRKHKEVKLVRKLKKLVSGQNVISKHVERQKNCEETKFFSKKC